ncbi:MAG TPA: ABC transporter substrate-binding protein [Candidatus Binatia bacterium]|jgi:NitT/TauT family transport system substrate-binding protein
MDHSLFRLTIIWAALALVRLLDAPGATAAEKINASYGAISGSMAPIWTAKEARLFDKQGLDLNLVYIPGGPRSIMSLIGNSLEFVNHSGMPALEAYQRGAETVMIASSLNQLEHAVMAHKSITGVEQLRGKIIGMSAPGALTDIALRDALRFHGISDKEVTIIPVGDEGARLVSLQTGRVQAVIISGIQRLTATRMGFHAVIDLAKLPIEIAGSSILARRSYLAQNPETVMKFLRAWIEGVFLFKAKPEFSVGVLKKYVANKDPEVLSAIYELNKQQLSTKPVPYVRVVKSMMQLLARTRSDLPSANPEGFVESRFINELEKAGFFEEMSRVYGK